MNTTTPIAIIGAGILGLTCAHALIRQFGQDAVHLYDEHGFPAPNASFLAGGMIAPYAELDHMPAAYLPAGQFGINYWSALSESADFDFEFAQNGSLLIAHDSDLHLLDRFQKILPPSPDWNIIDRQEILAQEPALAGTKFARGMIIEGEGHLHPQKLMRGLCGMIQNKHHHSATPEELQNTHDWVIDCRGMGAEDPTLRGVKGEILLVRNPAFHLSRPVRLMHPRYPLYIVPRADHVFMIGATIIESADSDRVLLRSGLELMSALFSLHSTFAEAEILGLQAGIRPAYPDNLPQMKVLDQVISCNGLYRHGYLLSPALAACVLSLVLDQKSAFIDLFLKEKGNAHTLERATAHG